MQLLRRYWYLLLLALLIIVTYFLLSRHSIPIISSTLPADQTVKVALLPAITLTFADGPGDIPITLDPTPPFSTRLVAIKTNSLTFTPTTPLTPNTTYQIKVLADDQAIYQFSFTTITSQTDQVLIDQLQTEIKNKYPLAKFTPYTTTDYRVIYSAPLTLEITLKTTLLSPDAAIAQVQSWVGSQGLDSTSHQYIIK